MNKYALKTFIALFLFSFFNLFLFAEDDSISFDEMKDTIIIKSYNIMSSEINDIKPIVKIPNKQELSKYIANFKKKRVRSVIWQGKDIEVSASSYLKTKSNSYCPGFACDTNLATVWADGVKGFGYKEWIRFRIKYTRQFFPHYMIIFPGHGKNDPLFFNNNHLKTAVLKAYNPHHIAYRDKERNYFDFGRLYFDNEPKYHVFSVGDSFLDGRKNGYIEFTLYIESVYKGSLYDDTCIAEVMFLGTYW